MKRSLVFWLLALAGLAGLMLLMLAVFAPPGGTSPALFAGSAVTPTPTQTPTSMIPNTGSQGTGGSDLSLIVLYLLLVLGILIAAGLLVNHDPFGRQQ